MGHRFLFVGNRRFVLEQMIREKVDFSAVIVIGNTHLERDFQNGTIPRVENLHVVHNKAELLELIYRTSFDLLVSNGCPYILPISDLPPKQYVNIHPSFLPDLRGADPTVGAILFKRDSGATCHVMDVGIDTGPIIAQIRIPYTEDLDVATLYQLSFIAEKRVFSASLARNFCPAFNQKEQPGLLYYSRKPEDKIITFKESNDLIIQKVKAFNNRSQGCEFVVSKKKYRVYSAERMRNPFICEELNAFPECTVALRYENDILFRKDGEIIRFGNISSIDGDTLSVGDSLLTS